MQNWDYGSPGFYFITICTKDHKHHFGKIENGEMILNELGMIVNDEWIKTPVLRPDMNVELHKFVTMPNHFHGIISIGENIFNARRDAMHHVSTNKFGTQSKNLASIIRGFKSSVTTAANKLHFEFAWQPRFHDHIIGSQKELTRISHYIKNNPCCWKDDKFFS
ncbi:MAG: transposase [Ginsengibacter sp.]